MTAARVGITCLGESIKRQERRFKSLHLHKAVTQSPRLFLSEVLRVKLLAVTCLVYNNLMLQHFTNRKSEFRTETTSHLF